MGNSTIQFGVVTTKPLLEAVQRFRYQVYVKECGFEPAAEHPTGLETDLWDPYAIHMAALEGGEVVGSIRLILESHLSLPVLKATSAYYEKPAEVKRAAEISRFAVHKDYRHVAENRTDAELDPNNPSAYVFHRAAEAFPSQRRRRRFEIILGLFRTLYRVTNRLKVRDWYLMAEKPLWYFLRRYHILIQVLGPEMDYHGPRSPYIANVSTVENNLLQANPTMIHSFMDSLTQPIPPIGGEGAPLEFPVVGMTYDELLQPSEPGRPARAASELGTALFPTGHTPA